MTLDDERKNADRAELEQAFSLFTEASRQLVESYQELEQRVTSLTTELAVANGALRKQFEEKAALSARLEALLDGLPAGVVEIDPSGCLSMANAAALELFGDGLTGKDWHAGVESTLKATAVSGEFEFTDPTGNERRIGVVNRTLGGGERIVLVTDLSERWRLQRQLEHHKRLASMGEMAAGLAHQLRTPLSTALLYVANLSRQQLQEPDRIRFSNKALGQLRYLESLIQDMLSFVRGQQAHTERINLKDLVSEAVQTVEPQERAMHRDWHIAMPDAPIWVNVSGKDMLGGVINLLENAVEATTDGGRIAVRLNVYRDNAFLEVEDNGCGIAQELQERLFEPFFTTRKEGTGLGLAIVRNLVTAYAGEIGVQSALGKGARFTIRLPIVK
ncbi:GHKL domain-containing protein [Burkholderiaceae bacterium DAT-1]|nr:GHKL domain-containing protein [Burkholderiaceae bacterium DAT-1]